MAIGAALLVMVAAILYGGIVYLPQLAVSRETSDQPRQAEGANQSPPRNQRNEAPNPAPEPEPQPDNTPADSGEPQPDDSGTPDPKPDDSVEQPKPTPEPKPDEAVEQPKPDDTVEQPAPKPDDTVEQPKEPEGTTSNSGTRQAVSLLRNPQKRSDLDVSIDGSNWTSSTDIKALLSATWFRSKSAVDLEAGGVLFRLEGTVHLGPDESDLALTLADDDLFIDSRGTNRPIKLTVGTHELLLQTGAVLVTKGASGTELHVYDGELVLGDETLPAGQRCELRKSGFGRFFPLRKNMSDEEFLSSLEDRVAYREDFNAEKPDGRLREGEIKAGILAGPTVFWGYPQNIRCEDGLVVRLRVRFNGATSATVTQFSERRNDNFSFDVTGKSGFKADEWYVLEIPVEQFLDRTTHVNHPAPFDDFQNVSIQSVGEKAQVELDWVELIRAVK